MWLWLIAHDLLEILSHIENCSKIILNVAEDVLKLGFLSKVIPSTLTINAQQLEASIFIHFNEETLNDDKEPKQLPSFLD